jgi:hypothetical protein
LKESRVTGLFACAGTIDMPATMARKKAIRQNDIIL